MNKRALAVLIFIGFICVGLVGGFGWYKLRTLMVENLVKIEIPNSEVNIYESKEVFFFSCIELHSKFQCSAYAESYFRGQNK